MIAGAAIAARETPGDARGQRFGRHVQRYHPVEDDARLAKDAVQRFRLGDGARKAVEHEPRGGVRLGKAVGDDADDDIVGDQIARRHDRPGALADFRAPLRRLAEHVSGGEMRDGEPRAQALGLGPLPRTGRAEKDEPHRRRPRSRVLRNRPSYWCARRCDCTWATKSIVTFTTMRRLVPPK